jgi:hypothetical protein
MASAIGGGAPSYNHERFGNESHYRCSLLLVLQSIVDLAMASSSIAAAKSQRAGGQESLLKS